MLGDIWTKTPGYIIDKSNLESAKIVDAELITPKKGISFKAKSKDASIIFPDIITDDYGHAMIMARIRLAGARIHILRIIW